MLEKWFFCTDETARPTCILVPSVPWQLWCLGWSGKGTDEQPYGGTQEERCLSWGGKILISAFDYSRMKVRVINNSGALCIIPHCTKDELCSSDTQFTVTVSITGGSLERHHMSNSDVKVLNVNEILTISKLLIMTHLCFKHTYPLQLFWIVSWFSVERHLVDIGWMLWMTINKAEIADLLRWFWWFSQFLWTLVLFSLRLLGTMAIKKFLLLLLLLLFIFLTKGTGMLFSILKHSMR